MPAVLSKPLARLPLEAIAVLDRQRGKEPDVRSVPVSCLHTVVLLKRLLSPPRLSWSCHAAKKGVQEPELAAQLLRWVDPVPDQRVGRLANLGFDAIAVTNWVLEEEVHALNRHLHVATAQLRRVALNNYIANKHEPAAHRILQQFQDTVKAERPCVRACLRACVINKLIMCVCAFVC